VGKRHLTLTAIGVRGIVSVHGGAGSGLPRPDEVASSFSALKAVECGGGTVTETTRRSPMTPYVPRMAAEWDLDHEGERWYGLPATCCFVDITGFTTVSERLARLGPLGAEQLTELLDQVFGHMLAVAYEKGGSLLKFGGDALLLAFARDDHPRLAVEAAVAMRRALSEERTTTGVGRVELRASMGLHTGTLFLFRTGGAHRELLVAGPDCSTTILLERGASSGEILVSESTAASLAPSATTATDRGARVRTRRVAEGGPGILRAREVPTSAVEAWVPTRLRERLTERAGEAEHRNASIAFVRYSGVDRLMDGSGGDAVADALDEIVSAVQSAAEHEGVTVLGSDADVDGGKLILAAGVPSAQEDDEGRMLRAAREIAQHSFDLDVHVGVNRGGVFAGDVGAAYRRSFTVIGDTVNVAARLASAAGRGEVLASAAVLERSRTAFDATELGSIDVKGRRDAVATWSVGPAVGARHRERGELPFRGRDAELATLAEALDAAAEGAGGVVVVEGDRGSGKTRLCAELLAQSAAGSVLRVQGESFSAAVPYWPFRAALREVLGVTSTDPVEAGRQLLDAVLDAVPALVALAPLLAPVVGAELAETEATSALAERFVVARTTGVLIEVLEAARPGVLLVVVEDAHWFDAASGELAAGLAAAAHDRPWLLCVTRRPMDAGFVPVAPDQRVVLGPLDEASVGELVDLATQAAPLRPQHRDSIVVKAAGNPLFVEELLRLLRDGAADALPDSLDAIAMREIDLLSSDARRVVLVASVLGRETDHALLRALAGDARFDGAEGSLGDLLKDDGTGRMRFRHALLQEAAYGSLPFRTRQDLHRRAGLAIEATRKGHTDAPALLSMHFAEAQDWERSWRYGRLAADVARKAHAQGEVLSHLERAAVAGVRLGSVPDALVAKVLEEAAEAAIVVGHYERADATFHRAAGLWKDDPVACARLSERRAYLRSEYQGRLAAAIRQVHVGVTLLDQLTTSSKSATRVRASLLAREADVRARQGRFNAAISFARRAESAAEEGQDERTLALALSLLDQALTESGRADEATHLPRALELYERLGALDFAAMTLGNLGSVAYWRWDWDDAADCYARAAVAATAAGDLATAAIADVNLGELRVDQGRADDAVSLLMPALRTLTAFGYVAGTAAARVHLGRATALAGDPIAGTALLRAAVEQLDGSGQGFAALDARAKLAETLVLARDTVGARTALDDARLAERTLGTSAFATLLDRVEVLVEIASGERDEAAALLAKAAQRARDLGATYDLCVLLSLADRLGEEGGTEAAALARRLGVVAVPSLAALSSEELPQAWCQTGSP
jgi:class 3 adenylate cyclase/tetratricopeptide (TPR) repeat protein